MVHAHTRSGAAIAMIIGLCCATYARAQSSPPATVPSPLPTMDELHQMYESGDYRACLQQIARVMRLSDEKRKGYDADELQLLRGRSLLSLGDPRAAKRWLEEASRSSETEIAIHARGLLALIARSKGTTYTPRVGDRTPLDITDPVLRKQAMHALLNDEIDEVEAKAKLAIAADNLAPTLALAPKLLELHAAERLATGKNDRTGPIAKSLGEHARELMTRELDAQNQRITGIEKLANQLLSTPGYSRAGRNGFWWNTGVTRRGLTSDERGNLDDLIQYLAKIEDTAKNAQRISRTIDGDVDAWSAIIAQAAQVKAHAQAVLDAEGIKTGND